MQVNDLRTENQASATENGRVYKPAFSHEKAVGIIRDGRGKHFDPLIVDALFDIEEEFRAIAAQFSDCLLYTSPSPRDRTRSRMPSSA